MDKRTITRLLWLVAAAGLYLISEVPEGDEAAKGLLVLAGLPIGWATSQRSVTLPAPK